MHAFKLVIDEVCNPDNYYLEQHLKLILVTIGKGGGVNFLVLVEVTVKTCAKS